MDQKKTLGPEPGKYNPNYNVVLLHQATWSFPQSTRPKATTMDTPSANAYTI